LMRACDADRAAADDHRALAHADSLRCWVA
jgi:hypothetical protein